MGAGGVLVGHWRAAMKMIRARGRGRGRAVVGGGAILYDH